MTKGPEAPPWRYAPVVTITGVAPASPGAYFRNSMAASVRGVVAASVTVHEALSEILPLAVKIALLTIRSPGAARDKAGRTVRKEKRTHGPAATRRYSARR